MRVIAAFLLMSVSVWLAFPAGTLGQTYELPEYDDARRWNRAATLLTAVLVGDVAKSKARGLTPTASGVEAARIFGPPNGWNGADAPFSLFRGMYFNWMSDPDQVCELLQAGETVVRARCNRPYLDYFGESGESYGVTVGEYEAASEAFASTIADAHGMDWQQRVEGDDLVIEIRKR